MMKQCKEKLNGKSIWLSIDEATDVKGRFVANVIVAILSDQLNECEPKFLDSYCSVRKDKSFSHSKTI